METYSDYTEDNGIATETIWCAKCHKKIFEGHRPAHPTKQAKARAFVENRSLMTVILNDQNHECGDASQG